MSKPANSNLLRLGTRASALALTQSGQIARRLERLHRALGLKVELVKIGTQGDKDRSAALSSFGSVGVFVKELEQALLDGSVDFAVHSLKDLPIVQPKGLLLAAVSRREDVRDVAITRGARLAELPEGSVIGSGSPRRRAQLALRYPQLRFEEIRGNVETRIEKVRSGHYAGTILARAGLKRLNRTEKDAEVLPLRLMLPAPGQGALGLECRSEDERTCRLLQALQHVETAAAVTAERACLEGLGGGCHLPLGAYGKVQHGKLHLRAMLALEKGPAGPPLGVSLALKGPLDEPRKLGHELAARLLASQTGQIVSEFLKLPFN